MEKIVFGLASTEFQAEAVVNELKVADFLDEDISTLLAEKMTSASRPSGVPAGLGGGALGWLPGIEGISIPGAGPFIAAGPIVAALKAAAVGGASAGIADALCGMGLAESNARRLERKIRAGLILIAVHAITDQQADRARSILEQAEAKEIASSAELQRGNSETSPSADETGSLGFGFGEPSNAAT